MQVLTLHRETLLSKTLLQVKKRFPSVRFLSPCFVFAICILHWHLGVTFWQEKNLGTKALLRIWNASDHWRGSSLKKRQTWTHIRRLPDVVFSTSNASSQSNALHTWGSDSFLTCFVGLCWDYKFTQIPKKSLAIQNESHPHFSACGDKYDVSIRSSQLTLTKQKNRRTNEQESTSTARAFLWSRWADRWKRMTSKKNSSLHTAMQSSPSGGEMVATC